MKANEIIGLVMIVAGIALGLYVGLWVCFIGGIVDVITQLKAPEMSALGVAFGVAFGAAKVFFAGFFGWLSGICLLVPGIAILDN